MKLKHFFTGIIISLLLGACVGEDIEQGSIELALTSDNLFAVGINEKNAKTLQLTTTLDEDENFEVKWSSSNPDVINVDNSGKLVLSADENQIGKSTLISAKAFNKGETEIIAELDSRSLNLGVLTIKNIEISGILQAQKKDLLKFGFEEKLSKKNTLSSIDVASDTQRLEVTFINFGKEATLAASETKRNMALSEAFTIVVADETVVVAPPKSDPTDGKVLIGSGSLQPNNGYNSKGGFQIFRDSNGAVTLEFDNNFSAPIPRRELYASNTIGNDVSNAKLIAKDYPSTGAQTFNIDFDITNFKYIYIYCASIRRNSGFGEIK